VTARPIAITRGELGKHSLPPVVESNKNERGRLLVVAGSRNTPGSAAIAATAAMRSGCGKVTIATVESMAPHVALAVPEALVLGLAETRQGAFARSAIRTVADRAADFDALVVGPGMRQSRLCADLAANLLKLNLDRLVLDAAMLYALPAHDDAAREATTPILLPHNREMAALLDCEPEMVDAAPLASGLECAARYGALTLVKGPQSHIVTPDGRSWKYQGGGPGLGISGSGDTLAGILGGLLARGADPLAALLWAVWLHGEAGASLGRKVGMVGFLARELSGEVPALLPS
jgi:ADP-dependent NAD(P)H-hydrate dehydratase